jgi:rod shape determining protein RodA
MLIDRRYFRYFDWLSFIVTLILLGLGLLFVFSSTYTPQQPISPFFKKQLIGTIIGLGIYIFFCIKDLRLLTRLGYIAYFFVIILLLYANIAGSKVMGARRWVPVLFLKGQPSELAKLFLPTLIAHYRENATIKNFFTNTLFTIKQARTPIILLAITFFLILKQPDLGTALIILFSGLILFWIAGLNKKFFLFLGLGCILCAPIFWKILKPYQQQRILVLLGSGSTQNERYQIEQSKIAIGSGGLFGKGLLKGTQNKLAFLPEDHTDFIFSVICEEWGFFGAMAIIILFCILFVRILYITIHLPNISLQIISVGLIIHIILSFCINIGMISGILPTVGISLPLFSYGLSNLWVTLASLGWLNNIAIRRFYY